MSQSAAPAQPTLLPVDEIDGGLIEGAPGQLFIVLKGEHRRVAEEQAEALNRQRFEHAKGNPDAEYQPPATTFDVVKALLNQALSGLHRPQQEQQEAQQAEAPGEQADPAPPSDAIPLP